MALTARGLGRPARAAWPAEAASAPSRSGGQCAPQREGAGLLPVPGDGRDASHGVPGPRGEARCSKVPMPGRRLRAAVRRARAVPPCGGHPQVQLRTVPAHPSQEVQPAHPPAGASRLASPSGPTHGATLRDGARPDGGKRPKNTPTPRQELKNTPETTRTRPFRSAPRTPASAGGGKHAAKRGWKRPQRKCLVLRWCCPRNCSLSRMNGAIPVASMRGSMLKRLRMQSWHGLLGGGFVRRVAGLGGAASQMAHTLRDQVD